VCWEQGQTYALTCNIQKAALSKLMLVHFGSYLPLSMPRLSYLAVTGWDVLFSSGGVGNANKQWKMWWEGEQIWVS
jgi:hypothetical protein